MLGGLVAGLVSGTSAPGMDPDIGAVRVPCRRLIHAAGWFLDPGCTGSCSRDRAGGRGIVGAALRSRRRVYRNCEDRPSSVQPGVCSIVVCREVWSAWERHATARPVPITNELATPRRDRSSWRALGEAVGRTDGAIRGHRPWTEPSAHTGHRRRWVRQQAVVDLRCAYGRSPRCQNRGWRVGGCGGGQRRTRPADTHRRRPCATATRARRGDAPDRRRPRGAPDRGRAAPAPTPAESENERHPCADARDDAPPSATPAQDHDEAHVRCSASE